MSYNKHRGQRRCTGHQFIEDTSTTFEDRFYYYKKYSFVCIICGYVSSYTSIIGSKKELFETNKAKVNLLENRIDSNEKNKNKPLQSSRANKKLEKAKRKYHG